MGYSACMPVDDRKARIVAAFNRAARSFDSEAMRFLAFCADRMILRLNPAPGSKVLDCGTGTGAVAAAAAQAVGPAGRVIGIDIADEMLARAQRHLSIVGLHNIDLFTMDAEQLEFRSQYFDYTLCSYALAYLRDPFSALHRWARVTRSGGQVMIATFARTAFYPFLDLLLEGFRKHGVDADDAIARSIRHFGDAAACRSLLEDAGLHDVQVTEQALGFHLRRAEEWWSIVSFVILPAFPLDIPIDLLAAVRDTHLPAVRRKSSSEGVWLDASTLFSVGIK